MKQKFEPGTRVRLHAPLPTITLAVDTGTIVRPDEWDGYFIVRLDKSAAYTGADGDVENIIELREADENLTIIQTPEHTATHR